ncbi:MAG: stage sporulation protein [Symbiobacteriaceae bacterium]|jgi:stage II sporulation protein D|nr:stage sporulation protein [Symbiobacteriaceae bacterium]
MRRFLIGGLVAMVLVLVALPALLGRLTGSQAAAVAPAVKIQGSDQWPIKVYFPETRQVESIPLGEYLKGVVAAEMERDFETAALEAQMIVARTYALKRMKAFAPGGKGGCPDNAEADICADPKTGQAYISKEAAVKRMGALAANALWKRLDQIQAETDGIVLRYKGALIDPLYHSVSGTKTEDSGSYYAHSLPYLQPVDDHWGADSPRLKKTYRLTPADLSERLAAGGKDLAVPALAAAVNAGKAPVEVTALTGTGRVQTVKVNDVTLSGREFRELLSLQSTNFTVTADHGEIVITTTGYGHGVGMSQWGANGMAKAGKNFRDILTHYYTGVEISSVFED